MPETEKTRIDLTAKQRQILMNYFSGLQRLEQQIKQLRAFLGDLTITILDGAGVPEAEFGKWSLTANADAFTLNEEQPAAPKDPGV